MRAEGLIGGTRGLDTGDHACWVADDNDQVATAVVDFLGDGLDRGQRLQYVTAGTCAAGTEGALRIVGEVDSACADAFRRAIAHPTPERPDRLRVDGTDLVSIDHRGLTPRARRRTGSELFTGFAVARVLAEKLGLTTVKVRAA